MNIVPRFFRYQAGRLIAILLIALSFGFTLLPALSENSQKQLAKQFQFKSIPLPEIDGYKYRKVRQVNPQLEHMSAWISSVGASVALNDLDGDGLPNDICWVDVRIDQVIIAPVPGTGQRYPPQVLDPSPLRYDKTKMAPMGCLPGDFNEDGHMDLLVYYWGRTPIAFIRHPNTGSYIANEIFPGKEIWNTNAATIADVDGDGHLDLIIGNYFRDGDSILDPSSTKQVELHHGMSRACNGGMNRVLLWAGTTKSDVFSVRFREAKEAFAPEVACGWTLAAGAADLDGDLLPEIYFANDFGPDQLLHNRSEIGKPAFVVLKGEKGFDRPASLVLGRDSFKGMGVDFGDINGDGFLDIYVSNIADEFALQESHFLWLSTGDIESMQNGYAPYVHGSEELGLSRSGWGWESRLADFNNDGVLEAIQATGFIKGKVNRWPELQSVGTSNDEILQYPMFWPRLQMGDDISGHNPNAFFARAKDGRYYNLAENLGFADTVVTRGIATGDVDGDGDLDFVFANQWERSTFYRNDCPNCGPSITLHLRLSIEPTPLTLYKGGLPNRSIPSRPAVGASAKLTFKDGKQLVAQVDGGNGHSGSRSPEIHFGLGNFMQEGETPRLDIKWRDAHGNKHEEKKKLKPGNYTIYLANFR